MNFGLKDIGLLHTQAYIDGEWIDADDGATPDVLHPATGETVAGVAMAGQADARTATPAAARAAAPRTA